MFLGAGDGMFCYPVDHSDVYPFLAHVFAVARREAFVSKDVWLWDCAFLECGCISNVDMILYIKYGNNFSPSARKKDRRNEEREMVSPSMQKQR